MSFSKKDGQESDESGEGGVLDENVTTEQIQPQTRPRERDAKQIRLLMRLRNQSPPPENRNAPVLGVNRRMQKKVDFEQQEYEKREPRAPMLGVNRRMQKKVEFEQNAFEERANQPPPPRPQTLNPADRFRAALQQAQATLDQAGQIQPVTPTQVKVRQSLGTAQTRMNNAVRTQQWPDALTALNDTIAAAKQLIASKGAVEKRTQKQTENFNDLAPSMEQVKKSYFNNPIGGSKAIKQQDLSPGPEFKAFIAAMEKLEKERATNYANPEKGRRAATDLIEKARGYLDHYDERYATVKPDSKAERKRQLAEEGFKQARHVLLALEFDSLGGPPQPDAPWSQKQEIQFNQVQSQFFFETGYREAAPLDGEKGINQSFWVKSSQYDQRGKEKQEKELLFKPRDGEQAALPYDYEKFGISAVKESLASTTSKLIAEQTGLDLGVPETSVARIGGYAISGGNRGEEMIGSIQQFEKSDGELKNVDPSVIAKIPKEDWHRGAIQDIISLNVDRHDGNFMVQKTDDPNVRRLVPIDHGNTLPTPRDFKNFAEDFAGCKPTGPIQNATLKQPAAYEPFTPEMLEALSRIDPDAIADNMRQHCAALDEVTPGLNASQLLPDDAIELSRRTTTFLKRAAPFLSPAEIMLAISAFKDEFADFNQDIGQLCDQILQAQQGKGEAYKEVMLAPTAVRANLLKQLSNNGWNDSELIRKSPDLALQLLVRNVKNDPKPRDPVQAIKDSDFVDGTRRMVDQMLHGSDDLYGKIWDKVDQSFPAAQQNAQERTALETATIVTEPEAKALYFRAARYLGAREQAIADYLMDQGNQLQRTISNLIEGEDRKNLDTWFNSLKQYYGALNVTAMPQQLERMRELEQRVADRPTGPLIEKLRSAEQYITPRVKQAEDLLARATGLLTDIRDAAALAVQGRARQNQQTIQAASETAGRISEQFASLLEQSKQWVADVQRTFEPMLPRDKEMTPGLVQNKRNLDLLYRKVLQDIDNIDFLDKDVQTALRIIADAGSQDADPDALLAQVVYADQNTCQTRVLAAGRTEASAATDLDGLTENLAAAAKQGVAPQAKARLLGTARNLMRELVGKLNVLRDELQKLADFANQKLDSYPTTIDRKAVPFKEPFEQFDLVMQKLADLQKSCSRLVAKAKEAGEQLVSLM